jgi:hypothetical protein
MVLLLVVHGLLSEGAASPAPQGRTICLRHRRTRRCSSQGCFCDGVWIIQPAPWNIRRMVDTIGSCAVPNPSLLAGVSWRSAVATLLLAQSAVVCPFDPACLDDLLDDLIGDAEVPPHRKQDVLWDNKRVFVWLSLVHMLTSIIHQNGMPPCI